MRIINKLIKGLIWLIGINEINSVEPLIYPVNTYSLYEANHNNQNNLKGVNK